MATLAAISLVVAACSTTAGGPPPAGESSPADESPAEDVSSLTVWGFTPLDSVTAAFDLYEEQTAPLIEHYTSQGRLVVVDGVGAPEEVFRRLTDAITKRV